MQPDKLLNGYMNTDPQAAPEPLERVRMLLNSWHVPNDTRVARDDFAMFAAGLGVRDGDEAAELRRLRDDVRSLVERRSGARGVVSGWIERYGVRPRLDDGGSTNLGFVHPPGRVGETLAILLRAVAVGEWDRLKACPDCRWVFYDRTRNAGKKWCGMYAGGPGGRACGTIAKVKRYRRRQGSAGDGP